VLASAQLGVPVAAITIGSQLRGFTSGEPAALLLGALVTMAATTLAVSLGRKTPAPTDGLAEAGR